MATLSTSIVVRASPERTFQVFTDFPRAAEMIRGIRRVEMLTPGPAARGTRFRETRVMFGREATEEMEVVEYESGRAYALAAESCGTYFKTRFDFRGEGGGTRVDMSTLVEARSLFSKLMMPLMGLMKNSMRKAFEKDLEDLRKVCETSA